MSFENVPSPASTSAWSLSTGSMRSPSGPKVLTGATAGSGPEGVWNRGRSTAAARAAGRRAVVERDSGAAAPEPAAHESVAEAAARARTGTSERVIETMG